MTISSSLPPSNYSVPNPPENPFFKTSPPEIFEKILSYFTSAELINFSCTSKSFYSYIIGFLLGRDFKFARIKDFSEASEIYNQIKNTFISNNYSSTKESKNLLLICKIIISGKRLPHFDPSKFILSFLLFNNSSKFPQVNSEEKLSLLFGKNPLPEAQQQPDPETQQRRNGYIEYLNSGLTILEITKLKARNLEFNKEILHEIPPIRLNKGILDTIYGLDINDVKECAKEESQLCQFLSSLISSSNLEGNEYSNLEAPDEKTKLLNPFLDLETLDEKIELLIPFLREKSSAVIKDLALMVKLGIPVNKIKVEDYKVNTVTPLYDLLNDTDLRKDELTGYINILLAAGTNLNQQNLEGKAPLHNPHLATFSDSTLAGQEPSQSHLLNIFLKHGADINLADDLGQTPLMKFCRIVCHHPTHDRRRPESLAYTAKKIKESIDAGADVTAKDKEGLTALHHAVYSGNTESVQHLINALEKVNSELTEEKLRVAIGALLKAEDKNRKTAINYADEISDEKERTAMLKIISPYISEN